MRYRARSPATIDAHRTADGVSVSKAAFDKIAEGLTEALEIVRGNDEPYRLHVLPEIVQASAHPAKTMDDMVAKLTLSSQDYPSARRVSPSDGECRAPILHNPHKGI